MKTAAHIEDFGMDTATLAGPLEAKLAAARQAGFGRIMLAARDVAAHPQGAAAAIAAVRASGLEVTGLQVLRDFEGLSGHLHDYKVDIAKQMILMTRALDAKVLLACSSTLPQSSGERRVQLHDLRKLAMLALPLGVRIAFKATSWGRHLNSLARAWSLVEKADYPNLGLGIDSSHMFAAGDGPELLDDIDPAKIHLVLLSDFMGPDTPTPEERTSTARHFRVFPGEGAHSLALATLVLKLNRLGYRGDYSFEVFNDDYQQIPLPVVAQRARRSALWLGEDVLRRSVPLPGKMRLKNRSPV